MLGRFCMGGLEVGASFLTIRAILIITFIVGSDTRAFDIEG